MSRRCSFIFSAVFALGLGAIVASPFHAAPAAAANVATTVDEAATVAPTLQQLQIARARVGAMLTRVRRLLREAGHTDTSIRTCRDIRSPRDCAASALECAWDSRRERCRPRVVSEADLLAISALLVIQSDLFEIGELIDQAIAAWPAPAAFFFVSQACTLTTRVISTSRSGQFVASLPPTGLVTPDEFTPLIDEANNVRALLGC